MSNVRLFHGTDQRILDMSPEERAVFKETCLYVASQLKDVFIDLEFVESQKDKFRSEKNPHLYYNLVDKLVAYDEMRRGNPLFQYDSFCLTNVYAMAEKFAKCSFAFGEVGLIPYRMMEALYFAGVLNRIPSSASPPDGYAACTRLLTLPSIKSRSPLCLPLTISPRTTCSWKMAGH